MHLLSVRPQWQFLRHETDRNQLLVPEVDRNFRSPNDTQELVGGIVTHRARWRWHNVAPA